MSFITVNRSKGKPLIFLWRNEQWQHQARKYIYRIIPGSEGEYFPEPWIAIGYKQKDGSTAWCNYSRELKVASIEFATGTFYFKKAN